MQGSAPHPLLVFNPSASPPLACYQSLTALLALPVGNMGRCRTGKGGKYAAFWTLPLSLSCLVIPSKICPSEWWVGKSQ